MTGPAPVVAILMPLVLVPTVLVLKHRHQRREWEHLERLKAMGIKELFTPGTSTQDIVAFVRKHVRPVRA